MLILPIYQRYTADKNSRIRESQFWLSRHGIKSSNSFGQPGSAHPRFWFTKTFTKFSIPTLLFTTWRHNSRDYAMPLTSDLQPVSRDKRSWLFMFYARFMKLTVIQHNDLQRRYWLQTKYIKEDNRRRALGFLYTFKNQESVQPACQWLDSGCLEL